jgi:hypothetical protein
MAVYTDIAEAELAAFLARYDIGGLLSYTPTGRKGPAASSSPSTKRGWSVTICLSFLG